MTRLPFSEELYQLLRRVNEGFVVWHNSCDVHAPGFAWVATDMSEAYREQCGQAYHARLVDIGVHHDGASAVSLTDTGEDRLRELQARHNAVGGGVA